jgi:hypothetical protein
MDSGVFEPDSMSFEMDSVLFELDSVLSELDSGRLPRLNKPKTVYLRSKIPQSHSRFPHPFIFAPV